MSRAQILILVKVRVSRRFQIFRLAISNYVKIQHTIAATTARYASFREQLLFYC